MLNWTMKRWRLQLVAFFGALLAVVVMPVWGLPGLAATPAATQVDFVSPQWLAEHANEPQLRILDVRTNPLDYISGHIPAAVHLAENTFRVPNGQLPVQYWETDKIAALFSQAGVNADSHVVIYADGASILGATMVSYLLERSGHQRVSILDGGYKAYQAAGLPTTKVFPVYAPGNFTLRENAATRVTLSQVRQYLGNPDVTFIDPRPPALFAGEEDVFIRNGHIPGAKNIPWQSVTLGDDNLHQLRRLEEVRSLLESRGVTPDDDIIMTCSTGREATLQYVVLKHLLGYPKVRIYEGSWTEYSSQPDLPVATGRDPSA